jgi:hypothetical protein
MLAVRLLKLNLDSGVNVVIPRVQMKKKKEQQEESQQRKTKS